MKTSQYLFFFCFSTKLLLSMIEFARNSESELKLFLLIQIWNIQLNKFVQAFPSSSRSKAVLTIFAFNPSVTVFCCRYAQWDEYRSSSVHINASIYTHRNACIKSQNEQNRLAYATRCEYLIQIKVKIDRNRFWIQRGNDQANTIDSTKFSKFYGMCLVWTNSS